tara:strand:+ start:1302 stop:2306 length:1005 start_codon:yes stop_codon:yes gene_type:complete
MDLNNQAPPTISIFMPVFNGEKHLEKSIESVLNQSFKEYELVIVDDSSTDSSLSIINNYQSKDERIKVFKKQNGGNVPKSWNYVMPLLSGEFITYMSQDDKISENYLMYNYKRFKETGANIIIPEIVYDYGENKTNKSIGIEGDNTLIISGEEAFILTILSKLHGFIFVKSSYIINEVFDENIFNSDEYIFKKILLKTNKVAFSKGTFYYNLSNKDAISKKFSKQQFERLLADQKLILLMEESNIDLRYIHFYERASLNNMLRLYSKSSFKIKINDKKSKEIFNNHFKFLKNRRLSKSFSWIKKPLIGLLMINKLTIIIGVILVFLKNKIKRLL